MANYEPNVIEPKWQKYWEENKTFRAPGPGDSDFDASKPKYYILDMFPYPSGNGLHVGHPEGYTATDILARYKRMTGHNVLHPMGWDAFGLPAEQYAVKTGTHPSITTKHNIENFRRQIKTLGFSYDWDREVSTADPFYYRWTQWIFNLLYDTWFDEEQQRGRPISELPIPDGLSEAEARKYVEDRRLAYLDEIAVWWCPELGTVLANEEVIDGLSERGDFPCYRAPMRQWMLRITDYAQRLLDGLEEVDWPAETKKQQAEWIGRSQGAQVWFALEQELPEELLDAQRTRNQGGQGAFKVFTTRPDTLFGATYMVLAPEHPLVNFVTTDEHRQKVEDYVAKAATKSELDRSAVKEKTGVFTGGYAVNPVNDERIPIWVADYVLYSYGTGAIMAVPGHDERDFDFAMEFGLEIRPVYSRSEGTEITREVERDGKTITCFSGDGIACNSPWIDGLPTPKAKEKIIAELEKRGVGEAKINYRLRDWIFSRQRYWGEPFPIIHTDKGHQALSNEELPLELPPLDDFKPTGKPEPLLAKAEDWVAQPANGTRETNTMPNWAGSCWYYLRFLDPHNDVEGWSKEKEQYWMPVDLYVGGREHAVLHLLYARFWHKVLFDRGYVSTQEPFKKLFHQGLILAFSYTFEGEKKLIPSDEIEEVSEGEYVHKESGRKVVQTVAKMSKSLRNVVNPDDIIEEYGADSFRIYEMFMGPLEASKPWNSRAVDGVTRFLARSWRLYVDDDGGLKENLKGERPLDEEVERALNKCIKKVTEDLDKMAFNTAVSAMMIFVNEATAKKEEWCRCQAIRYAKVLSVFAPHLGEELWELLGCEPSIMSHGWPQAEEKWLKEDTIEMPVQINGKVRAKISVGVDWNEDQIKNKALEAIDDQLNGSSVRKVIVVPKRIVNVVVK